MKWECDLCNGQPLETVIDRARRRDQPLGDPVYHRCRVRCRRRSTRSVRAVTVEKRLALINVICRGP